MELRGTGFFHQINLSRPHVSIWVVVKIMVPLWVPMIIRHLVFGVPKKGPYFDNHPYEVEFNHREPTD